MALARQEIEALYVQWERPLYNLVYRWLWQRDEAADVVQEAFARLWQMGERVRPESAKALLFRIAVNVASKRRRARRLWGWVGLEALGAVEPRSFATNAPEALLDQERQQALMVAIEALPEKLRRVVLLCELAECGYAEVAEILAIPLGTVASRRNAAVKRLRQAMAGWEVNHV